MKAPTTHLLDCIISAASAITGVPEQLILGETRDRQTVDARHLAEWAAWMGGLGSSVIGRRFNRDRSTVIHAYHRVERLRLHDVQWALRCRAIQARLVAARTVPVSRVITPPAPRAAWYDGRRRPGLREQNAKFVRAMHAAEKEDGEH